MMATCSAFSDKCMDYRNEEINSILFLEMSITCDEKLWEAGAEYMDAVRFTTLYPL